MKVNTNFNTMRTPLKISRFCVHLKWVAYTKKAFVRQNGFYKFNLSTLMCKTTYFDTITRLVEKFAPFQHLQHPYEYI